VRLCEPDIFSPQWIHECYADADAAIADLEGSVRVAARLDRRSHKDLIDGPDDHDHTTESYPAITEHKDYRVMKRKSVLDSIEEDPSFSDEAMLRLYRKAPISVIDVANLDLRPDNSAVIIISGKHRLSLEARKMMYDKYGYFVNVGSNHNTLTPSAACSTVLAKLLQQLKAEDYKNDGSRVISST